VKEGKERWPRSGYYAGYEKGQEKRSLKKKQVECGVAAVEDVEIRKRNGGKLYGESKKHFQAKLPYEGVGEKTTKCKRKGVYWVLM